MENLSERLGLTDQLSSREVIQKVLPLDDFYRNEELTGAVCP